MVPSSLQSHLCAPDSCDKAPPAMMTSRWPSIHRSTVRSKPFNLFRCPSHESHTNICFRFRSHFRTSLLMHFLPPTVPLLTYPYVLYAGFQPTLLCGLIKESVQPKSRRGIFQTTKAKPTLGSSQLYSKTRIYS